MMRDFSRKCKSFSFEIEHDPRISTHAQPRRTPADMMARRCGKATASSQSIRANADRIF
jgi:hypothetical protein